MNSHRVVSASRDMVVIDNALSESEFQALHHALMSRELFVDTPIPTAVGPTIDSTAVCAKRGPTYVLQAGALSCSSAARASDVMAEQLPKLAKLAVERAPGGDPWTGGGLVANAWKYPPGAGMAAHRDDVSYSGAFVYFCHQHWRIHWGGLLLVFDKLAHEPLKSLETVSELLEAVRRYRSGSGIEEEVWSVGLATTVLPKPNRLVLLSPSVLHMITKVDTSAGDNVRLTLTGFVSRSTA